MAPVSQSLRPARQRDLPVALRSVLVGALLVLVACSGGPPEAGARSPLRTATPADPTPADPTPAPSGDAALAFEGARVTVEIADDAEERRRGLMERASLPPDAGMLFLFERPTEGGFWMKNTLIPLSIAYMAVDGDTFRVLAVLDMEPCEGDPCPTYAPGTAYEAALEVNQGWFARHGVGVGAAARLVEAD